MHGTSAGPVPRAACAVSAIGLLVLLLGGCSGTGEPGAGSTATPSVSKRERAPFWTNPDTEAARQVSVWRKDGRADDAALLERIASEPVAEWVGIDNPRGQTRAYTQAATAAGRRALLVVYNIPHRDCGQYSSGGAADGGAYRAWLDKVAAGIGGRKATVILEPDALPHVVDGCTPAPYREEHYALLTYAVRTLKALPRTKVYLDAGNAGWVRDPRRLVEPLLRAGVEEADGFALNTANFYTTRANAAYGKELSGRLGGKHFVIDTSRNGRGPLSDGHHESWCNPPGRGLGVRPTTRTGDRLIDAYLWIKRPGDSDGTCKGGPAAGTWWPEYALGLARNAAT